MDAEHAQLVSMCFYNLQRERERKITTEIAPTLYFSLGVQAKGQACGWNCEKETRVGPMVHFVDLNRTFPCLAANNFERACSEDWRMCCIHLRDSSISCFFEFVCLTGSCIQYGLDEKKQMLQTVLKFLQLEPTMFYSFITYNILISSIPPSASECMKSQRSSPQI